MIKADITTKPDIDDLMTAIKNLEEKLEMQVALGSFAVGGVMVALFKALEYLGV